MPSSTSFKIFLTALFAAAHCTVDAFPQGDGYYSSSVTEYKTAGNATATPSTSEYHSEYSHETSGTTAPPAPTDHTAMIIQLNNAPTVVQRFQALFAPGGSLLPQDEIQKRVVFDFNNAQPAMAADGEVAKGGTAAGALGVTFPILNGLGISVVTAFLNPCGINTPHVHPRATEFLTVVEGELNTGFILEDGFTAEITGKVKKFQGTVFPMGSIHYQFNPTCKPATFIAALNSEDPGTSQIAPNFFGLNPGVVNATLGGPQQLDGKDIDAFERMIPINLAQDVRACLKQCDGYYNEEYEK